ncbi:hypothetical protein CK203_101528 [Vitis vinifera]|uniref:Transmembrane protein n=1 Tax=Vitis vinifera TaxID=29760 RepID=A0A438F8Q2_VITVI|nr:hypothetical protein CK203_101528 [Vitis vinifera]
MGGKLGVKEGYGVGLWKTIRKDWSIMSSRCSFTVGNGRKMFGILLLKGGARVGILISLDLVMIGWWFAWKVF